MKWLTNVHDPSLKDAKQYVALSAGETLEEAWERWQRYLAGKIIGDPKATDGYSVDQLRAVNKVGIYAPEE